MKLGYTLEILLISDCRYDEMKYFFPSRISLTNVSGESSLKVRCDRSGKICQVTRRTTSKYELHSGSEMESQAHRPS